MNHNKYTRRQLIKLSVLGLFGLGFSAPRSMSREIPFAVGRVATPLIYLYGQPNFRSERAGQRKRDSLINLLEEIESPHGPKYNPRWYRIDGGYIHSGHVQRIAFRPPNEPLVAIPPGGIFGEVTVPFTRTFYQPRGDSWQPLYRVYYESVHWIHDVCEQSEGTVWYKIFDPKNGASYFIPASDVRPIPALEYRPIAIDVPAKDKKIVISIEAQTLTAYEADRVVLHTQIASGVQSKDPLPEGELPTDTPKGAHRITLKMPSRHMGEGKLTRHIDAYELPGVPWTMAFHKDGYAMHGSYWHDNFGHTMSHGCVNMRNADALWLFRWTEPVYDTSDWYVTGVGTLIQVI
jgi:lipoprotein-anchoring transpeptidase ErfK/SrfK